MTPTSPISFILIIFVTNSNLMYLMIDKHEAEVIQKIREVIITRLNRKPLYVGDNIVVVGKTELDDVHMVGIYGIGGIGKTTIAMAFYNDISSRFDGSSGLLELQKKLLKDILKCESTDFDDTSEGINVIKKRLCSKRVLIVLDDVEELEQLENLAGKNGWYGAKSTIIITTKDTSLLSQHGVNILYEVKELNHKEAIDLFNWWAFKQNIPKPKEDFESLSHCVVGYAKGLPIALKVLGGFLFGKKIDEWKSALHKLEKIPHMKVQSVLKVRDILGYCMFFKRKYKDLVSRILGRYANIGIKVLHERCLITISQNKLDMHDLLQQMGQEIVRQECLKEPGERSRLWDSNDVDSMLTRNTVRAKWTEAIEGLFVEIPTSNKMQFSTNSFTKMNRLRLFIVYNKWYWNRFKGDFEFPSSQLRYLNFYGCSLESLPTNFNGRNLVELDLVRSGIKKLWKGDEIFDNLKVINLSYSRYLVEIPDFSSVPNLEILNLEGCINLLKSLPETIYRLKSSYFSLALVNIENLRELSLDGTAIKELPKSIERLGGLQDLHLSNCSNLVNLPESISIQSDDCRMSSWKALNLSINYFSSIIPISIIQLSKLRVLDLSHCQKLLQIPELPPSLRILDVHACPCLETLSSPSSLLGFSLFRCFKSAIEIYATLSCRSLNAGPKLLFQIVIPGNNGIPEWISQQKKGSEITIELPIDWYHNNDFLGVALYSIYVPLHIESNEDPCSLKCQLNFHVHQFEFLDDLPSKFWSMNGLSSEFWPVDELSFRRGYLCHHNGDELNEVWVENYPKVAIPNQYWSNKWRHLKASFHGYLGSKQVKVKECGFHLISMPKIVNRSIPQDRSIKGVEHNRPPILIQHPDVQRCCDTKSVPEDTNVNAQSCCDIQ
ncbi:hypothetical protein AAG906_015986 [Vitis piasezkii]